MSLKNCPECGKLFVQVSRNLCPGCVEQEEKEFESVADYLRTHKDTGIAETSEATGVSEERIIAFLRDGRLQTKGAMSMELQCERCGKMINTGRLCEDCTKSLLREIQSVSGASEEGRQESDLSSRLRYHTADRYKK